MLLALIIFVAALALLDFASARWGRDSRDGKDWFSQSDVFEVAQR